MFILQGWPAENPPMDDYIHIAYAGWTCKKADCKYRPFDKSIHRKVVSEFMPYKDSLNIEVQNGNTDRD